MVWITLDPIQKENSLEFVSGSHKGLIYDGSAFDSEDDTKPIYGDGSMPRLPDIEADRSRWPITSWAVTPGDAVIFHPATLHGGAPTTEGMRRRTLSLRFFGPDAIYRPLPTNGVKSVGIEGDTVWNKLNSSLNPGEPLHQSRLFLQVRPLGNSQYRH